MSAGSFDFWQLAHGGVSFLRMYRKLGMLDRMLLHKLYMGVAVAHILVYSGGSLRHSWAELGFLPDLAIRQWRRGRGIGVGVVGVDRILFWCLLRPWPTAFGGDWLVSSDFPAKS